MLVAQVLHRLGGTATRADLIACTSRNAVDAALRHGEIVAGARGRYSLPGVDHAVRVAHELTGVLCLTSAAMWHGWEVKHPPDRPHVLLPTGRKITPERRALIHLHRADLHPDQRSGIATSPRTTLEMGLRTLPADEALTLGDSFLRHDGYPATLAEIGASARGPGSRQVRWVAAHARRLAANPFESVLRAIALRVPGLHVEPQLAIRGPVVRVCPDLVDRDLGIVLEADSFEWHGDRAALHHDANRYNRLVAAGWLVLRFSWEQVMFRPDEVLELLTLVVGRRQRGLTHPTSA